MATLAHPPARFIRALTLADLLDAAGIDAPTVQTMQPDHWRMLTGAVGGRIPSQHTRDLVISMLRSREDARARLQRNTQN